MDVSGWLKRVPGALRGMGQGRPDVGLLIRPTSVEGVARAKGASDLRHASAPIAGGDEAALTEAIRQVWQALGVRGARAAASLMSPEILVRFFTLPAMSKSEGESAAQFEVRKYIPFKLETLAWDVHLWGRAQATPSVAAAPDARMDAVFAAMPREGLDRVARAIAAAGVEAAVIEPACMSLARLAASADRAVSREGAACLVDVERERGRLIIVRDGMPILTREFALSDSASSAAADTAPNLAPVARVMSELRVSMDFFSRECPGERVETILLLSDRPEVSAWCEPLAVDLRCHVQLGGIHGVQGGVPHAAAAAVGAISAAANDAPALNFLKRSAAQANMMAAKPAPKASVNLIALAALLKNPRALASGAVAAALPLLVCAGLGWHAVGEANARLAQAKATMAQGPNPSLAGLDQQALTPIRDKAMKQLQLLRRLIDGRTGVAARLDALARSLPDGVWLTSVSFEDHVQPDGTSEPKLSVAGACYLGANGQEFSAIQAFQSKIREHPTLFSGFDSAQVDQISAQTDQQRQATYRTFQLQCKSERKM